MNYHEAFIPDQNYEKESYDVLSIIGRPRTIGDIGIEIECEGNKFPKAADLLPKEWLYHQDGSLRGVDNAEYVLKKPIKFDKVPGAVHDLYEVLDKFGTVMTESNRTSVHVHLNVQQFHLPRLTAFLALYFCIEEILTEWCGDHRVGNLFCLRAKDAPAIVSKIKRWIVADGKSELTEGLHYSGMNAQALVKFGSLEIRSLRGVSDPALIVDWVSVLERLYNLSAEYKDPRDVTENYSGNDPVDFLKSILGDTYEIVRNGIEMEDEDIRQSMKEGIRLAQDLCYCRDWSRYKEADRSKNPFGRNKKTTMSFEGSVDTLESLYVATPTPIPSNSVAASTFDQYMAMFSTAPTIEGPGFTSAFVPAPTWQSNPEEDTETEDEEFDPFYDEGAEPEEEF